MLREPQHERIFHNHFKTTSVRPESSTGSDLKAVEEPAVRLLERSKDSEEFFSRLLTFVASFYLTGKLSWAAPTDLSFDTFQ
jgi:hypothetical protein